jgi:hypothetical protein
MYLGKLVELADRDAQLRPDHPYPHPDLLAMAVTTM